MAPSRTSEQVVHLDWCDMPVVSLIEKEQLFAEQFGCGIWSGHSNDQTAKAEPSVGLARIRPDVHDFLTAVPVIDVVPRRVHVYVDGVWAGSAATGGTDVWVPIISPLVAHQKVKAWQYLCFHEGLPRFGPEVGAAPVVTEIQAGDTSKATPYTIVIVANPALETPVGSGVFIPDPVMGNRAGFNLAVTYVTNVLFGLLAGQAEQLLADPAIGPRIRVLQIFQPDLPATRHHSLVGELGTEIVEPRRQHRGVHEGSQHCCGCGLRGNGLDDSSARLRLVYVR